MKTTNGDNFVILEMKQKLKCYKETVERIKDFSNKNRLSPTIFIFLGRENVSDDLKLNTEEEKKYISKLSYFNEIPLGLEHEGKNESSSLKSTSF